MKKKSVKSKIIAHLNGNLNEDELKELLNWIAESNENARFYAEVKDIWEYSRLENFSADIIASEWKYFEKRIGKENAVKPFHISPKLIRFMRFAAIMILGFLMGYLISTRTSKEPQGVFCASAPYGSISKVILPDSTEVFLNAGSELKYRLDNKNNRKVFLDGEGWFKVTKDKKRPFIVQTNYYQVQVLGTEFDVKAYRDDKQVTTTLEKGTVQILSSDNFKIREPLTLKPGQQMVFDKEKRVFQVREVETRIYTSWRDNKLEFLKLDFGELVTLLERRYGVSIHVQDKSILKYHYSGTLKNETIVEVLDLLEHTLPIQYKIDGQQIIISAFDQERRANYKD
jgi:ferric-dicitrate binding protein FerR (iron transport regulator)